MVKKKEVPLTKMERFIESAKRATITLIASTIGGLGLRYLGIELDPGMLMLIAVGCVEFIWKFIRTGSYTKQV